MRKFSGLTSRWIQRRARASSIQRIISAVYHLVTGSVVPSGAFCRDQEVTLCPKMAFLAVAKHIRLADNLHGIYLLLFLGAGRRTESALVRDSNSAVQLIPTLFSLGQDGRRQSFLYPILCTSPCQEDVMSFPFIARR